MKGLGSRQGLGLRLGGGLPDAFRRGLALWLLALGGTAGYLCRGRSEFLLWGRDCLDLSPSLLFGPVTKPALGSLGWRCVTIRVCLGWW